MSVPFFILNYLLLSRMLKNATILGLALLLSCQLLTAQVDRPLDVANEYLQNKYSALGLTALDVAHYKVSSKVVSQHNKLTHVYLQQSHADIKRNNRRTTNKKT